MNYETYSLSIDEVRKIINAIQVKDSSRKPINISFYIASEEAQNAMLKMLEDYEDTQFIINVPDAQMLLPTIRSRLIEINIIEKISNKIKGNLLIINLKNKENDRLKALVNKYIKMSLDERLKCKEIELMLEKEVVVGVNNKEIKSKDGIHQFLISVVNILLNIYKEEITNTVEGNKNLDKIKNIKEQINQFNILAEYIIKSGSSAKMIMEYVAHRLNA